MKKLLGKIIVCNRLRVNTDGNGVVTLVAMKGCPLKCKYCINANINKAKAVNASVETLYNTVVVDDIYFQGSEGGICFGGHEPLLQAEYIKEFEGLLREYEKDWKVYVETSLNVETDKLMTVINSVDYWIIDVKDMNEDIYKEYTGIDNKLVKKNLRILLDKIDVQKIKLRLPLIKNFNNQEDREKSKLELLEMGFQESCFDEFDYVVKD